MQSSASPASRFAPASLPRRRDQLNLGHILRVTQNRPMLALKLAETADGYAAGPAGTARLVITDGAANAHVHMLRSLYDAIMVGSGTVLADDPLLTVRLPGLESVKPLRIVLDSKLALRPKSRLVASAVDHPTLVLTTAFASPDAEARLREKNVEVARIACDAAGHVDLAAALSYLAGRGLTRIFCEGGPRLAAGLLQDGLRR